MARWWNSVRRPAPPRPNRHGRHGRAGRSPVVRPPLPPLDTRIDRFSLAVGAAADYLRGIWPDLREVRFEIGAMPVAATDEGIPRWSADREQRRIVMYRIPVERLAKLHHNDDLHQRVMIEGEVFRAAADYLDRDPWDLGPDSFRF